MTEILRHPTVIMEDRERLPGQLRARQDYIPEQLLVVSDRPIHTLLIQAKGESTYDRFGRIQSFRRYGEQEPTEGIVEPGQYAFRVRDPVWSDGDPSAYVEGDGYNTSLIRAEFATRDGFAKFLHEAGLDEYGIESIDASAAQNWEPAEFVFVKPRTVSDISNIEKDPGKRARIVRLGELEATLAERFAGGAVLQRREQIVSAFELLDHLGINTGSFDPEANYLHALRVFAPLWLPADKAPTVELRLTDPRTDVGKSFATKLQLVEPELLFGRLPGVAKLHRLVCAAAAKRYGESYIAFDYIIRNDWSVKVLNGLVRPLTPNLEHQSSDVQHLANATADVEVRQLAKLALSRFAG